MKTFFLNENKEVEKKEEISYITESELEFNILKVENMMLESDLAYQNIIQEAILGEANELQVVKAAGGDNKKEDGAKKGITQRGKETLTKFFKEMIGWFQKVGKALVDLVKNVITKATDTIDKLVTQYKDATANTDIVVRSKYDVSKLSVSSISQLASDLTKENVEDLEERMPKVQGDKAKPHTLKAREARAILVECKKLADKAKTLASEIAKDTRDGIRESKKGETESKKDNSDRSLLQRLKETVTTLRKRISGDNKKARQAVKIASSLSKAYARGLATAGAKTVAGRGEKKTPKVKELPVTQ